MSMINSPDREPITNIMHKPTSINSKTIIYDIPIFWKINLNELFIYIYNIQMFVFSFLSLISVAYAFSPVVKENVLIRGSTAPLPDFDPIGFSENKDIAYLREAELKHGRWGMVGAASIPLIESYTHRPAIYEFQDLSDAKQVLLTGLIAAAEFQFMLNGWKNPWIKEFALKDDYQPGDLGFKLWGKSMGKEEMMDKEINNGRLAMIAFLGMLSQELVTNLPLFP